MKENDKEDENELNLKESQNSESDFEIPWGFEIEGEDNDSDENDSEYQEKKIARALSIFKIKDYLMMIFLLLSSSVNFSILYIPLIVIGMSYIFLLLKYTNHLNSMKRKLEIISLIYSFLLLIFKSTILGMIQNDNIDYDSYSYIFNNLGIKLQKDKPRILEMLVCFIGELILIIISVISIIISRIYKEIDFDKKINSFTNEKFIKKVKTIIYLGYISILTCAIYNKSFLTIIYLLSYQFLLIILVLKIKSYNLFKNATIIYLIFFSVQVLLINIFNIYSIQEKLLKVNVIKDGDKVKKVYSIFTMIGINYSFYHSLLDFLYEWLSYIASVFTIVLFTINQSIFIEKNSSDENNENINNLGKNKGEKEVKKGICYKIKNSLVNFFTNPEFILFFFRLLSLLWIYLLRNFFTFGIFIFIFFSFIFDDLNKIHYLVIFILIPIDFLTIGCLHVSNINGISENLNDDEFRMNRFSDFAYEKDETNIKYILAGIYFLFIVSFLSSFISNKDNIKIYENQNVFLMENKEPLLNNLNDNSNNDIGDLNKEEEEIKLNNKSDKNEENGNINFLDVLLKLFYSNIDKITLVAMYFISMHTINIIHFFFIVIFMIQILKLDFTIKYSKLIVILVQILFLFEYIVDITKNYYKTVFIDNFKLFQFLLSVSKEDETYTININIEIFCYVAIFVFYFQDKLLTSKKYNELKNNKNISFSNYINVKFGKFKKVKRIGSIIISIMIEIYIYIMFIIFFLFCCNIEINFLISIKLGIFLLVVGGYFKKTQTFFENIDIALKVNYFLIGYCCFSSFVVYGYQLLCLDFFGIYENIKTSDNLFIKNLSSFGLINYESKNLLYKLLPHFLSNFLSILLYNVMNFIYERIDRKKIDNIIGNLVDEENEVIINKDDKPTKIIEEDKKEDIINIKEINIINEEKEKKSENEESMKKDNLEEEKIILEEKDDINTNINNNKLIDLGNIPEVEEIIISDKEKKDADFLIEIEKIEEKYKLINIQLQKQINYFNIVYYICIFINFILNLYSPLMILIFCYFFTTYKMSFSMLIYFFIICFNFIIMFKNIIKSLKIGENKNNHFMFTQLILYKKIETKNHEKIHNNYDYKIYKIITYFTLLFLFLSYLYSIIYELKFNNCDESQVQNEKNITESDCTLEKVKYGNYVRSIAYIFGMYNYSDVSGLFDSNYLYLLFFPLILVSKYIKMILYNLEGIISKNREKHKGINKKVPYMTNILTYIKQIKIQKQFDKNEEENLQLLINDYENVDREKLNIKQDTDYKSNLSKIKGIFKKSSKNVSLLHTTSMAKKVVSFLRVFKRIYEHFIIFAIISCIVIKINIWSIIYMIIIILLLLKQKNIKKFYYLFIFFVTSTLIQSMIFLANMNKTSFSNIDENIIEVLNDTLSIPLYEKYLGEKYVQNGVLLGVGINHSQLLLIWCEHVLIFLIYIYLYYFCFSIFNDKQDYLNGEDIVSKKLPELKDKIKYDDNQNVNQLDVKNDEQIDEENKQEIKNITKENIMYKLLANEDFKEDISKMDEKNYEKIVKIMQYNFNEEIVSFKELHEVLKLQENQKKQKEQAKIKNEGEKKVIIKSPKNKKFNINVSKYILYLFLHNVILVIILIISMMCPGLLSAIVICFCLYFLYFCHLINKGKKSYYPFIVQRILRFIIIFDISFQLIIQIVLIYYHEVIEQNNIVKYILETIGFREILNEKYEISSNIIYLLGKSFCFFCMTIQKIIYSSNNFKIFYLSYIIKMKIYSFKLNSIINAMIFNNDRINEMNTSLELKLAMEKSMEKLKETITEYSSKLEDSSKRSSNFELKLENSEQNIVNINNLQNEDIDSDSDIEVENNIENKLDVKENLKLTRKVQSGDNDPLVSEQITKKIIKNWILDQTFLFKIYLFFNRKANYLRFSSYMKEGNNMIIKLKKGQNYHTPNILKKINHQLKKLKLLEYTKDEVRCLKKFLVFLNKMEYQDLPQYIKMLNSDHKHEKHFKGKNEKLIFNQLFQLKNSSLFKKNLTKWYLIKKIFRDWIVIISNNFCWVCYFFMLLNHMKNASIISIVYPLSIFCYSLLENPRPSKYYWRIIYIYTFLVLICKCFFQKIFLGRFIDFADENEINSEAPYEELKIFFDHYPIGIKIYDDYREYFLNLFLDFLVIICLIINRNILMLHGLWDHNEEYFEDIGRAMERTIESKCMPKDKVEKDKKFDLSATLRISNQLKKTTPNLKKAFNIKEKKEGYFAGLFPKLRNKKPGKDFYYLYTLAMILLIIYVLIFYTTMVKDKTYGDINISTNQFSGMSIILVLIHMIILILDRVIYLSQNRYKIKYDYILYTKEGKKLGKRESDDKIRHTITLFKNEDKQLFSYEHLSELSKDHIISIYQNEESNNPLKFKYILHILLTILSHAFIFFYITLSGNYNIYNATYCIKSNYIDECNDFQENIVTIFFYILYLFYLTFSALQIKYGFYDLKRTSIFKNVNSIHKYLFELYKIIPFYYPIKNVIDWTVTPTSFGIFEWFKFENIYDAIFKTYRLKYDLNETPVGLQIKKWVQIVLGGFVSFILVLILILPLILFSSLNPTSEINNVNSAGMKMYMSFVDSNKQERNILIFENDWAKGINNMTESVWDNYGYSKSYYTKTFPIEQVQIISFYSDPENSLSSFKLNHILSSLDSLLNTTYSEKELENEIVQCKLKIETDFMRAMPAETRSVKKQSELLICDYKSNKNSEGCKGLEDLYNQLNGTISDNKTEVSFNIPGFSPIVRLGAAAEPIEVELEKELVRPLIFRAKGDGLFEIYFEKIIEDNGIQYHVLNEKVSSGTFGYSVIGFYSAFILVIGTYVTNFFNYDPSSIIIGEMPHPEILLKICEGIKKSRYLHDFKNEEYYFNFLIEILRTPELVKKLTSSTLIQYKNRQNLPS